MARTIIVMGSVAVLSITADVVTGGLMGNKPTIDEAVLKAAVEKWCDSACTKSTNPEDHAEMCSYPIWLIGYKDAVSGLRPIDDYAFLAERVNKMIAEAGGDTFRSSGNQSATLLLVRVAPCKDTSDEHFVEVESIDGHSVTAPWHWRGDHRMLGPFVDAVEHAGVRTTLETRVAQLKGLLQEARDGYGKCDCDVDAGELAGPPRCVWCRIDDLGLEG